MEAEEMGMISVDGATLYEALVSYFTIKKSEDFDEIKEDILNLVKFHIDKEIGKNDKSYLINMSGLEVCSNCGHTIGYTPGLRKREYKFCMYCGKLLIKRGEHVDQDDATRTVDR